MAFDVGRIEQADCHGRRVEHSVGAHQRGETPFLLASLANAPCFRRAEDESPRPARLALETTERRAVLDEEQDVEVDGVGRPRIGGLGLDHSESDGPIAANQFRERNAVEELKLMN
ncbi:MAG: hypothetical protein AB2L07_13705 [Thermoanaerobaculaceae bacterium]